MTLDAKTKDMGRRPNVEAIRARLEHIKTGAGVSKAAPGTWAAHIGQLLDWTEDLEGKLDAITAALKEWSEADQAADTPALIRSIGEAVEKYRVLKDSLND